MKIISLPESLKRLALDWKKEGRVALVPTMGCLHEGHLQLVRRAKSEGTRVIVSIFVNPLQFGPTEDFDRYPRTFEDDVRLLENERVDAVFAPSVSDLYPEGFSTRVQVSKLSETLCGASRVGHFDGVATVCLKLFQASLADVAVFGEKDFQQLRILEKMAEDFHLSTRILRQPTVRESDGLALSSRNRYLDAEQRRAASRIPVALRSAAEAALKPAVHVDSVIDAATRLLDEAALTIEYLSIASEKDLRPVERESLLSEVSSPRLFLAARAGSTRLIDNMPLTN